MKYSLFILVLLGSGTGISAQSLEIYVQTALENNPGIKAAYAQFEAALRQSPQVSSLPDPTLTLGAFGRMMQSDMGAEEVNISLIQMFPWFGTLGTRKEAADLRAEARFQEYLDQRSQLIYEVKSAYAELYQVRRTIELQQENLEILAAYKDLSISGLKSGNSPMVNVVKTDLKVDAARTEVALLQERIRSLKTDFNLLLNRRPNEELSIQDSLTFSTVGVLKESVQWSEHPSVQKFQKDKEAFVVQQEVARLQGLPSLGLGFDYTVNSKTPSGMGDMNGQDMYMPMLSVSLPIFRKKYKAAKEEAEFMEEAALQEQLLQENQLTSLYEMTKYELSKAQQLLELYERQIQGSEQANKLLISAFSNSTGNFEEVLDMNQTILLLKMQQLEVVKQGFTAQAKMEYLFSKTMDHEQK